MREVNLAKSPAYRNRKILDFARDQPCVICGSEGTTVAAHYSGLYSSMLGKAMGQKAGDHCVAYLCDMHHREFDLYNGGNVESRAIEFMLAIFETQRRWLSAGVVK